MSDTKRAELERLLEIHKKTRYFLETQKAQYSLQVPPHVEHGLREACDQIARIEQELAGIVPDNAIQIDLWTRDGANPHTPGAKQLDWFSFFALDPPSAELWHQTLMPQLRALLKLCGEAPSCNLAVHAKAHISAAIALGHTFPTTSPYEIWVEQKLNEWWRSKLDVKESSPLVVEEVVRAVDQPEISVELSIGWDIHDDVQDTITALSLPIGLRMQLHLTPPQKTVADAEHAKAIAEQVRDVIKQARGRSRRQPIHLFAAVPVGLSVLIGAHLNACGLIQCYEHRKDQGDYVPACLLRG